MNIFLSISVSAIKEVYIIKRPVNKYKLKAVNIEPLTRWLSEMQILKIIGLPKTSVDCLQLSHQLYSLRSSINNNNIYNFFWI